MGEIVQGANVRGQLYRPTALVNTPFLVQESRSIQLLRRVVQGTDGFSIILRDVACVRVLLEGLVKFKSQYFCQQCLH